MKFRSVDAGSSPRADLVEATIEELVPLSGRIDVPQAPSASAACNANAFAPFFGEKAL
jgi:hypothetical protein